MGLLFSSVVGTGTRYEQKREKYYCAVGFVLTFSISVEGNNEGFSLRRTIALIFCHYYSCVLSS